MLDTRKLSLVIVATALVAMVAGRSAAQSQDELVQAIISGARNNPAPDIGINIGAIESGAVQAIQHNALPIIAGKPVAAAPSAANAAVGKPLGHGSTGKAPDVEIQILVSTSLGESDLHRILEDAQQYANIKMVFRGFPDGDYKHGIHRIGEMIGVHGTVGIVIDPRPFHEFHVEAVPAMIVKRGDIVSSVRGVTNPLYLLDRGAGDYGQMGPTQDIAEPDVQQEIEARIGEVDWEARRQRGEERFWQNAPVIDLPRNTMPRTRPVNMAVQATSDIMDAAGNVIIPKGTIVDPMKMRPFKTRLLIFDPNDPKQMAWAKANVAPAADRKTLFLVVNYQREGSWDRWKAMTEDIKAPVYLLTENVRHRFGITAVPSLVESRNGVMTVQEGFADETH